MSSTSSTSTLRYRSRKSRMRSYRTALIISFMNRSDEMYVSFKSSSCCRTFCAATLRQRFGQHDGVVLRQPILEKGIGDSNGDRVSPVCDKRRGLEPGGKAVAVNLGFDSGEDLVPNTGIHFNITGKTAENGT